MKKSIKIGIIVVVIIGFTFIMAQLQERGIIDKPKESIKVEEIKNINLNKEKFEVTKKENKIISKNKKPSPYVREVILTSIDLQKDLKEISKSLQELNIESVKILSEKIVTDSKKMIKIKAPDKYINSKQTIDSACNLYINIYSNAYQEINNKNVTWLDEATEKIKKANDLIHKGITQMGKIK